MKKLILMAAFVAGPILYAQQKPTAINDLKKEKILKTQQNTTTQATEGAQATQAKSFNLSDTKAANRKTSNTNTKAKTTTKKKGSNAANLRDSMEK